MRRAGRVAGDGPLPQRRYWRAGCDSRRTCLAAQGPHVAERIGPRAGQVPLSPSAGATLSAWAKTSLSGKTGVPQCPLRSEGSRVIA